MLCRHGAELRKSRFMNAANGVLNATTSAQRSRSTTNSRLISVTIFEISATTWLCSGSRPKSSRALEVSHARQRRPQAGDRYACSCNCCTTKRNERRPASTNQHDTLWSLTNYPHTPRHGLSCQCPGKTMAPNSILQQSEFDQVKHQDAAMIDAAPAPGKIGIHIGPRSSNDAI
jgi:hypothetical protein